MIRFLQAVPLLAALAGCATRGPAAGPDLDLTLRSRSKEGRAAESRVRWQPSQTAFIICDMWDDHWCKGAAARVGELAVAMDRVVRAARDRGVFIIHAPSSTVDFYKGTPARERARKAPHADPPVTFSTDERWGTNWCWPDKAREPDMPIDDSDMGCDCRPETCTIREAWTRQIGTIHIDQARDAITHDAQETYNLLEARGIDNVVLLGVHLNMCVLGRPFGIRQMVTAKKNVALMRDMTDTMYNSRKKPFVNHFRGTDLVVEHVEKYWCPTFTSADLVGGRPFRFKEDAGD